MSKITYRTIIKEQKYMQLLCADVISRFGDSIDMIVYSWIMYEVSGNASMIAFIMALNFLPTILLQPFVAVLVERMEKKKVMAFTDLGRGIIVLCTMLLYLNHSISVAYLMIATILTSTLESICLPASIAFVPKIISMDKIVVAKALSNSATTVAQIIGTSIAGTLIAVFGSYFALLIDAFTFIISAILIFLIRFKEVIKKQKLNMTIYFQDFKDGFLYLKNKKLLLAIVSIGMVLNAILMPFSSFQSIFVADYLKLDAQALSFFSMIMMIGMFIGSSIAPKCIERLKMRTVIIISGFLFAPFYLISSVVPILQLNMEMVYMLEMLGMLIFGISFGITNVCFGSIFIKNIDEAYQSRIGGITNALLTLMCPLISFICSFLAVFIRVDMIFLIIGMADICFYMIVARIKLFRQL